MKNIIIVLLTLILVGCGAGGSSTSSLSDGTSTTTSTPTAGATTASISGTSATGAYMIGADVTVTDSTGATVATTTTGTDGSYTTGTFNPSSFTPPYVVTVNGTVGSGSETLVSVLATTPSVGTVVNVTPITNAISSSLSSSGNPLDLQTNITTEKTNITSAAVTAAEAAYRALLNANMTSAGVSSSTNLISGTFNTNLDKLLDNVKIEVGATGIVSMSSSAGSVINDLGNTTTTPASASSLVLAKGVLPTASNATSLPAMSGTSTVVGVSVLESIIANINTCLALSTPLTTISPCNQFTTSNYLNSGRTLASDLVSTSNSGLKFSTVEILRQIDASLNREKLIVRFNGTYPSGVMKDFITVAENNPTGRTGWYLTGDQREIDARIEPLALYRKCLNNACTSRYDSGFSFYITDNTSDNATISRALVTGPGLPAAGVRLIKKTGCENLTIENGTTGNANGCVAGYRLASWNTNGTAFTVGSTAPYLWRFGTTVKTAAELKTHVMSINPLDVYRFEITKSNGQVLTYWNRTVSRSPIYEELVGKPWASFTPSSEALMTTATLYSGGTPPVLSWTTPVGVSIPFRARFTHTAGADSTLVSKSQRSASIPCSANTECVSGSSNYVSTIKDTAFSSVTNSYNIELVSRTRNGVIFAYNVTAK